MIEKIQLFNKAKLFEDTINNIDFDDADILSIEQSIYTATSRSRNPITWLSTPIAPLAEPIDLDALVGNIFRSLKKETLYNIQRLDNVYSALPQLNNTLKAELETVEKTIVQATDAIQDISIVVGDENKHFYWVSDSFNNNVFVDPTSTCLIDTDYGMATLAPESLEIISNYTPSIDRQVTNGIPGANLYIVNIGKRGLQDKELEPTLESADTRNFGSIFDLDPSTWFEIERNFIPPRQKLKMQGRSFYYSESGESKSIQEVTKKYDWNVIVEWPDGWQDGGADGKGVSLVEWRDLNNETTVSLNSNNFNTNLDPSVKLAFNLDFDQPVQCSMIKLLPFVREDSSPIVIELIEAETGGESIVVAKDIELGTNKSITKLQREILRRTGTQITGSLFSIPTDRYITRLRFILSSKPFKVANGFGHVFKDILTEFRTERNHLLWRSVDKWKDWARVPYNENPEKIVSKISRPAIVGTFIGAANVAYTLGRAFSTISKTTAIGGTLGTIGSWLGKSLPTIGAILALDQLVGGFFSVNKSSKVLDAKVGFDVFSGFRSAVGLRDLTIIKNKYSSESVLQSIKREFPGLVSKIGLFVDEEIPENWGPGDWLTYYVSVDGINWLPIPKLTDSTLDRSLTLDSPTKSIFFKTVFKRNSEDVYHFPRLNHYSLQGLPVTQ